MYRIHPTIKAVGFLHGDIVSSAEQPPMHKTYFLNYATQFFIHKSMLTLHFLANLCPLK